MSHDLRPHFTNHAHPSANISSIPKTLGELGNTVVLTKEEMEDLDYWTTDAISVKYTSTDKNIKR